MNKPEIMTKLISVIERLNKRDLMNVYEHSKILMEKEK